MLVILVSDSLSNNHSRVSSNKCLNVSLYVVDNFLRCPLSPAVSLWLTRAVFQWRCDGLSGRARLWLTERSGLCLLRRHGAGTRAGNCESCELCTAIFCRVMSCVGNMGIIGRVRERAKTSCSRPGLIQSVWSIHSCLIFGRILQIHNVESERVRRFTV